MRPLEGIRVLDLTQAYSGPFCTLHLADHGAEVIKIERPGIGDQTRTWGPMKDGQSGFYAYMNRNKRGITLDMKSEEGKEIFRRLLKDADVVCENYKLGVLEKLGFSYETMKAINPRIIYGNITGFGLSGPLADRPAYDIVAQAMSGMMDVTGFADGPATKIGPAVADSYTGTFLCLGIMMALYQRERTGEGCHVDVAMMDALFSAMDHFVIDYTILGEVCTRSGNIDQSIAPFDSFESAEGPCVIACGTDGMFRKLCEIMDRPDLAEDPRCNTNYERCLNYSYLKPEVEKWTKQQSLDYLEEKMVEAGIPFGRIQNIPQVSDHPQIKERNMLWEVEQPGMGCIVIPGTPIKFTGEQDTVQKAAPLLGEENNTILRELGYDEAQIEAFRKNGVI